MTESVNRNSDPLSDSPRLLIIAGPNGSGKSSIVSSSSISEAYGENIINPDNYARNITDIPDETEKYDFALNQCQNLREGLLYNHVSFGFETVASKPDKVEFAKKAVDRGYKLDFIYVTLQSPELCMERIRQRVQKGGHDVNPDKVVARYKRSLEFLHEYIELADNAFVFDNSGTKPRLVFIKRDDICEFLVDPKKCKWMSEYISPFFKHAKCQRHIKQRH